MHHVLQHPVIVDGFEILPFLLGKAAVRHAAFFPLVKERRAAQREVQKRERAGGGAPQLRRFFAAEAGNVARLVMVGKVVARPAVLLLHGKLPAIHNALEIPDGEVVALPEIELAERAAAEHGDVKVEHHHQLMVFRVRETRHILDARQRAFTHGEAVRIMGEHLPVHLLNEIVRTFLLRHKLRRELQPPLVRVLIRQAGRFLDGVHHVDAEARDATVHPEAHGLVHLLPYGGIFPVEVALLRREGGQVIFAGLFILRPRAAAEEGHPVVRRAAVFARAEIVIIPVGRIGVSERRLEPRVLIGCVVRHEIHHDADVPRLCLRDEAVEIRKRAVFRVDGIIIRNIIAIVPVGRGVDRREPNEVDPKFVQIIELGDHAAKIADAIPVCIIKRARPDLINDFFPRVH